MSNVLIVAKNPKISVSVPLGEDVPTLTGAGLGGWASTSVIEDEALSTWEGQEQIAQDLPLALDGWGLHPKSIEGDLNKILRLGMVRPNADPPSPPVFRVFGPVHFPGRWWVLPPGGIELSTAEDEVGRLAGGELYRQFLTLHMVAYNHEAVGRKRRAKTGTRPVPRPKRRGDEKANLPKTRAGDTLTTFAAREMGDWTAWSELSEWSGIDDPNAPLPGGIDLTLHVRGARTTDQMILDDYGRFAKWARRHGYEDHMGSGAWFSLLREYATNQGVDPDEMVDAHGNDTGDDSWRSRWNQE